MKKFFFKILIIILITGLVLNSISVSSISSKNNFYKEDKENVSLKIKEIKLCFSTPQITYDGKYAQINLNESDSIFLSPGKPILPKITKLFTFPLGTKIKNVEIITSEIKQLNISKSIINTPYPLISSEKKGLIKNFFDQDFYKNYDTYPKEWFSYRTGGGLNNNDRVTFLSIQLFPVKYLSNSDKIEYVEKIIIKIEYMPSNFTLIYPNKYDLLIISPSRYNDILNPLVNHKNNHDVSTNIVTIEEITGQGRDKQEQIKYFIKKSIKNWGIKYVLLVGNKTDIPVRYTYPLTFLKKIPTDLYYADIFDANGDFSTWDSNNNDRFGENTPFYSDDVDFYPDVAIGRLYCANDYELNCVVKKIINYENETFGQTWPNNIIICGGNNHPNFMDLLYLINPNNKAIFGTGQPAYEGEYIGDIISEKLVNFSSEKYYASSFLPNNRLEKRLTKLNINKAINAGAGFVFLIGHGKPNSWWTYPPILNSVQTPFPNGYTINQIKTLRNENRYPIIIFDACSCGDFEKSKSPIAWEAVKLKSKGAIASFAATDLAFGYPSTYCEKSFNNLITLGIAQAIADGVKNTGDLLINSINNYLKVVNFDNSLYPMNSYTLQIQELFGDPTLRIGGYQ